MKPTLIKQRRKDDCMSCTAAMATETTPDEYERFAKENQLDPIMDQTFIRYADEKGFLVGIYFGKTLRLKWMDELCCINLEPARFVMGVKSSSPEIAKKGFSHAVYYHDGLIYDPAKLVPQDCISQYEIESFLPVAKNIDHERWSKSHE